MRRKIVVTHEASSGEQNNHKLCHITSVSSAIFVVESKKERAATIRSYEREREKLRASFEAMLSGKEKQKKRK